MRQLVRGRVVHRDEHLAFADTKEELSKTIAKVLKDPEASLQMANRGHRYVHERYRWEALGEDLLDYWERIAFSGTRAPSR